jgi:catechol 2,3-dioxygenase-like lactoylglutathione lyase family enzyme
MEFTRIAFTSYCVTDLPRARAFYEGVLGLKILGANNHMVDYAVGADRFRIMATSRCMTVEPPEAALGDGEQAFELSHHTAFGVVDFVGTIEALKARGCTFVHVPEYRHSGFAMAAIADPDGNWLIIQSENPTKPPKPK